MWDFNKSEKAEKTSIEKETIFLITALRGLPNKPANKESFNLMSVEETS